MAHKCDWCWMTRTMLETQEEVSTAEATAMDAAGESATAQSHADDCAYIRACLEARDAAEELPGEIGRLTLRDLTEDMRGARVKAPRTKAEAMLGALVAASTMRWW